jgi:hypothetical protein
MLGWEEKGILPWQVTTLLSINSQGGRSKREQPPGIEGSRSDIGYNTYPDQNNEDLLSISPALKVDRRSLLLEIETVNCALVSKPIRLSEAF